MYLSESDLSDRYRGLVYKVWFGAMMTYQKDKK